MKKSMKKLALTRETVRRLAGADLNGVAGRGTGDCWVTYGCPSGGTLRCQSNEVACVDDTSRCPDTYVCAETDFC